MYPKTIFIYTLTDDRNFGEIAFILIKIYNIMTFNAIG